MKSQKIAMIGLEELLTKIEITVDKAFEKHQAKKYPKYVTPKVAREILGIGISKLQQLRNTDEIVYTRTSNRGFLYLYESLISYLDKNVVR